MVAWVVPILTYAFCLVCPGRSEDFSRTTVCPGAEPYVDELVVPLCSGRFPDRASTSQSRWVVHFYGARCRRCREAAIALRSALSMQQSAATALRFGAVDCHDARNERLCKDHHAWKLPVLVALGNGLRFNGVLDPAAIGEWLGELTDPHNLPPPAPKAMHVCPAFELYDEPRIAQEFLKAHNIYRCTAGLNMLVWDYKAFITARRYAERAPTNKLQHSPEDERKSPSGATYGENVAIGEGLWPGQVVARWHDEIRNTQGGRYRPNRAGLGHYTQLVWRKTLRVGCSLGQDRRVVICHYDPAGNEQGKHLSQVAPPLPGFAGIEGEERCGALVEPIGVP